MRTERTIPVVVFEPVPSAGWLVARTTRALVRLGIESVIARGAADLAMQLGGSTRPTWVLRAGTVPVGVPRLPPASATGRSLVAFGSTDGDPAWRSLLASTGGDLSRDRRLFVAAARA